MCVYTGTLWERIFHYACPSQLLFDPNVRVCNWPSAVSCVKS